MATFLLLISTPIVLLGMPSQALLTVKETKTTFWTSGKSAYSWNDLEWQLSSEACQNEQIPLSKRDREVICDLLAQPENGCIGYNFRAANFRSNFFDLYRNHTYGSLC